MCLTTRINEVGQKKKKCVFGSRTTRCDWFQKKMGILFLGSNLCVGVCERLSKNILEREKESEGGVGQRMVCTFTTTKWALNDVYVCVCVCVCECLVDLQ